MFLVVTGGSGSGKSAYAEKRVASFGSHLKRYYLATMENCDEESEKRIQRHRAMRADKGFETIESPRDIHRAIRKFLKYFHLKREVDCC